MGLVKQKNALVLKKQCKLHVTNRFAPCYLIFIMAQLEEPQNAVTLGALQTNKKVHRDEWLNGA